MPPQEQNEPARRGEPQTRRVMGAKAPGVLRSRRTRCSRTRHSHGARTNVIQRARGSPRLGQPSGSAPAVAAVGKEERQRAGVRRAKAPFPYARRGQHTAGEMPVGELIRAQPGSSQPHTPPHQVPAGVGMRPARLSPFPSYRAVIRAAASAHAPRKTPPVEGQVIFSRPRAARGHGRRVAVPPALLEQISASLHVTVAPPAKTYWITDASGGA